MKISECSELANTTIVDEWVDKWIVDLLLVGVLRTHKHISDKSQKLKDKKHSYSNTKIRQYLPIFFKKNIPVFQT